MQNLGSFPHTPSENTDHTATPPGPHFKDQEAVVIKRLEQQSPQPSLYLHAHFIVLHPQAQCSGKELSPRSEKQIPQSDPGACSLLGYSAANQIGHAWHWPVSLIPASPHPATTQGNICFGKQPVLSY